MLRLGQGKHVVDLGLDRLHRRGDLSDGEHERGRGSHGLQGQRLVAHQLGGRPLQLAGEARLLIPHRHVEIAVTGGQRVLLPQQCQAARRQLDVLAARPGDPHSRAEAEGSPLCQSRVLAPRPLDPPARERLQVAGHGPFVTSHEE